MRYFFDNNLAPRVAKAINTLMDPPDEALHLRERFRADMPDIEWITKLAEEGDWVIISGDLRITRNPHERKAWREAGLTAFFLKKGWAQLGFWKQAARLVLWWPDVMEQARRVAPGAGFVIPVQHAGRFEQVRLD